MCILDALASSVPALVCDNLYTILAQNPLNVALLGPLAITEGRRGNFLWRWFTDLEWRSRYLAGGHEPLGRHYVADLRATVARRGPDTFARQFVTALCAESARVPAHLGAPRRRRPEVRPEGDPAPRGRPAGS
jgi:MmyB-like transcription regulator ligand binding domain